MRTVGLAAAALLAATSASAAELVTNGDFSAGATGFSTGYTITPPGGVDVPNGNIYSGTNASAICGCFTATLDHTTGSGTMLVYDGAANPGVVMWSQTFAVVANSNYTLSFWAANIGNAGPAPNITASINNATFVTTGNLAYGGGWNQFGGVFNSGAATSVTLSFVDTANIHDYNDFAFDDVSFTGAAVEAGVPEPATWAMMIMGFGAAGAMLRRRQTALA